MSKTTRQKIYICEDDAGIGEVMEAVLGDLNFETKVFVKAGDLLTYAKKDPPDLLIMDWWLPDLPGEILIKKWRDNKNTAPIPCLVISAAFDIKNTALSAGADEFLAKPFNISDIVSVITSLLKK